jgi:hypothetical protein
VTDGVSVTRNGVALAVSNVRVGLAGLIWDVPFASVLKPAARDTVDVYRVTVTRNGVPYSYEMKLFLADPLPEVTSLAVLAYPNLPYPSVGEDVTVTVRYRSPYGYSPDVPGASFVYVWTRSDCPSGAAPVEITAARNKAIYTTVAADAGCRVSVAVSASAVGYEAKTVSDYVIVQASGSPPLPAVSLTHSGGLSAGKTVSSTLVGAPAGSTVSWVWMASGTVVAKTQAYTVQPTDQGRVLTVAVTVTHSAYSGSSTALDVWGDPVGVLWDDGCGLEQVLLTPRLIAAGGQPTAAAVGGGHVLRVCDNGDLRAYNLTGSSFTLVGTLGTGWGGLKIAAPGDWDLDGFNDLIGIDARGDMYLYARTATNEFKPARKIGHGWNNMDRVIPVGDITSDSVPDLLAITKTGRLFLYSGSGRGGFKSGYRQVGHGWSTFTLLPGGDLTNDGRGDIIGINGPGLLFTYAGRGNGGFQRAKQVGHGWSGLSPAGGGSLNADPAADMIAVTDLGRVSYYQSNAKGAFKSYYGYAWGWVKH